METLSSFLGEGTEPQTVASFLSSHPEAIEDVRPRWAAFPIHSFVEGNQAVSHMELRQVSTALEASQRELTVPAMPDNLEGRI